MKKNYQELFYEANKELLESKKTMENKHNTNLNTAMLFFGGITLFGCLFCLIQLPQEIHKVAVCFLIACLCIIYGLNSIVLETMKARKEKKITEEIEYAAKVFARSVVFIDIIGCLSKHFVINSNRSDIIMKIINESCWINSVDGTFDPEYICSEQIDSVGWMTSDTSGDRYFITAWKVTEDGFTFTCDKKVSDGTIYRNREF